MRYSCFFVLVLFSACSRAEDKPFYDDHERGWHWYEKGAKPDENKQKKKTEIEEEMPQSARAELKKYQEEIEEAKALAVMQPTLENVYNYQKLQFEMINKAGKFSDVWMRNVYRNPELDFTLISPVSQNARHIYLAEKREETEGKIKQLSKEYGLFFFFKNDCPYCVAFAPIVKLFSDKYNWEVLAISTSGEKHNLFERSVQDNGLSAYWNVDIYPSLFAVNPKTGHVIPIAQGMISIEEMEERIIAITKDGTDE